MEYIILVGIVLPSGSYTHCLSQSSDDLPLVLLLGCPFFFYFVTPLRYTVSRGSGVRRPVGQRSSPLCRET